VIGCSYANGDANTYTDANGHSDGNSHGRANSDTNTDANVYGKGHSPAPEVRLRLDRSRRLVRRWANWNRQDGNSWAQTREFPACGDRCAFAWLRRGRRGIICVEKLQNNVDTSSQIELRRGFHSGNRGEINETRTKEIVSLRLRRNDNHHSIR